ncbi:MAG: type I restriction enzyme HsdR N-terminal domain-containing protein, partial [Endomicrobium sp.]|nr:type I restriction enzyme HsdR N-terminal domain-containing protein [Endomicrobium sp.]
MKKSEVVMGSSKKRADIVVYEKERVGQAYIIVELKGPANPPFAGDIDDEVILVNSVTAKNSGGKKQRKVSRDILFI